MELKLSEIVSFINLFKTLTWGAIPLVLAFIIPIYYGLVQKLIGTPAETAATPTSFLDKVKQFFTAPEIPKWVGLGCTLLLVVGMITIKINQKNIEEVRKKGLTIKGYLVENNYYAVSDELLRGEVGVSDNDISDVLDLFPNDLIRIKNSLGQNTIIMIDSLKKLKIINESKIMLASYLRNSPVKRYRIDSLFSTASYFYTRRVCYELISDSSKHYYYSGSSDHPEIVVKQ